MTSEALGVIRRNIEDYGHHIYLVAGEASPRFAYTIGLSSTLGSELLLAGGIRYMGEEVKRILNGLAGALQKDPSATRIDLAELGTFTLKRASRQWIESLMLGAIDYYAGRDISAWQVIPDEAHRTIDVPELDAPPASAANRPWIWYFEKWPYAVPRTSTATTNLAALKGTIITEAGRWGDDEWELFAGSGADVKPEEMRVVPLGVLLAVDDSLAPVVDLRIGGALWRDDEGGEWNVWQSASDG